MKTIEIGLVGSGFAAALHAEAYRKIYGYEVRLAALYSTNKGAEAFAARHGIPVVCKSIEELLAMPGIGVIDICTPPASHVSLIRAAMDGGRHVICEKPLNGYFGRGEKLAGKTDKRTMYGQVLKELDELKKYLSGSGKRFFYAENFVYAPSIQKAREMLLATRQKILLIKGEESHSGSHSAHAALWSDTGGGSFIRQGCHPLSAALYLKSVEAEARGEKTGLASVMADTGSTLAGLSPAERTHIAAHPVDVEDWANVAITFSDGTKAAIQAGDMIVGGVRNTMEIFTAKSAWLCNIAPNDQMRAYDIDDAGLESVYFTEKVETKTGWQDMFISEEISRGYTGEMQDFIECIDTGRKPQSDFDLAYETMKAVYGAYVSAEEGRRFVFEETSGCLELL